MSLAIVGMGLVTPFGTTPTEHAFFLRASVPAPATSPFHTREGERVDVNYCRWLGAASPLEDRLAALGDRAMTSALAGIAAWASPRETAVLLCTSKPRPGLDALSAVRFEKQAAAHGDVKKYLGDAGAFAALREARELLAGGTRAVLVVAVDSYVAAAALEERVRFPPSYWDMDPPPLSEGAAAMVLMDPTEARRRSALLLGSMDGAAVALGPSHDDNDDPVDGAAMVVALRQLPEKPRPRAAYGPWRVDLFRRDEFQLATARASDRFVLDADFRCLELHVGRLGAASGLANAVYGVALHAHAATDRSEVATAPFLAWAISPDGVRGAALLTGGRP